jgi:GH24 family phage-related lysozyme (muramidase)
MPTDFKTRVKAVQSTLGITVDGDFGLQSALAFISTAGIDFTSNPNQSYSLRKSNAIKAIQRFAACDADGVFGNETLTAIENFLNERLPAIPVGACMLVSKKSLDMLIAFEVSSKTAYNNQYKHPIWPGGESGITIGIGYDIGYTTVSQFKKDWEGKISTDSLNLLSQACGVHGTNAQNQLSAYRQITITYENACDVFHQSTLPQYARQTKNIYPGVQKLPPDAQGALLSLVYNRGTSLVGNRRKERKNIVAYVASGNLSKIAHEIRAMKRLWQGQGLSGLLARREEEAQMVENATFQILPAAIIAV